MMHRLAVVAKASCANRSDYPICLGWGFGLRGLAFYSGLVQFWISINEPAVVE
jgi:hypothetical protein